MVVSKWEEQTTLFYRFKPLPHQLDQGMKYSLLTSTKLWALVAGHGQCEWSQGVRPSGLAFDISFAGRHKSRKYVFRTRKGRTLLAFLVFNIGRTFCVIHFVSYS